MRKLYPLLLIVTMCAGVAWLWPDAAGEIAIFFGGSNAAAQGPFGSKNPFAPYFPSGPSQPESSSRPNSWPGGSDDAGANAPNPGAYRPVAPQQGPYPNALPPGGQRQPPPNAAAGIPPVGQPAAEPPSAAAAALEHQPFDSAQILARVGSEVIQASEVLPGVNGALARMMEQQSREPSAEDIDKARLVLIRQAVNELVETKLLMADVRRTIPAANLPKVEEKVNQEFEKSQLKKMMESTKVASRTELDAKLRKTGSSLDLQRRAFFEHALASQWLHQQLKEDDEITHAEMLKYYRDHVAEYETTPKARWEHIKIKFTSFASKDEAYRNLAQWGNELVAGGSFSQMAKLHSDDPTALDGGVHDWTTKGSLVSGVLDEAIFGLPVGRLSPILEDEFGFHIVRVVEREDLRRKPFSEAQVEIKKKIKQEKANTQMQAYLDKLRAKTPVWTIFDEFASPAGQSSGTPVATPFNGQPRR